MVPSNFFKSCPSTTDIEENCSSNSFGWGFFKGFKGSDLRFSFCSSRHECSTKIPGMNRIKARRPVDALTHLELQLTPIANIKTAAMLLYHTELHRSIQSFEVKYYI
jgi:hypothetical protein